MSILILNQSEVEQLLPMRECIDVMAEALAELARGSMHQPLRMIVRPPEAAGVMGLMPAYHGGETARYGLKAICVFPGNPAQGKDAHQGSVILFSGATGELLALMNAAAITAIRTAAVSGVATRLLAREDAAELAIIGSGVQARTHLAAMACVRPIRYARIVSRDAQHARAFTDELAPRYPFPIEPVARVEDAVRGADIIVTATTARAPIIQRAAVAAGAHINAVGSSIPTTRELDTKTIADALLFVDRRESTLNEAGDYLFPLREGAIGPEHIRAELGELLLGAKSGRTTPDQITVFKSLGLAVEDLAAAEHLYRKAEAQGVGTRVEF